MGSKYVNIQKLSNAIFIHLTSQAKYKYDRIVSVWNPFCDSKEVLKATVENEKS